MKMKLPFRRSELVCREAVELITDYLEGSLSAAQRRRFEKHIGSCGACTQYLEQMRATIRLTGRIDSEDLSAPMREDLTEVFRRWSSEED
jgi:anti-sigma factor RsiW